MRTSYHRSLGRSPAEIVYGQRLLTPAIWEHRMNNNTEINNIIQYGLFTDNLQGYRKRAYEIGNQVKLKDEDRYNRNIRKRDFVLGEKVLRSNKDIQGIFDERNTGPYRITKVIGHGVYEIADEEGNQETVHADRLAKYIQTRREITRLRKARSKSTLRRRIASQ
ncbi:hypothetical protein AX774_g3904 [Zancudomyces culisetae]|uniref:Integrase p58-like C-terminal domain-containing protein n=1 Tax=Zancudomyces culisetae TaxID=1213189 RepID=A0A1R1PNU0_ZANCU|nr:hypothetical protein AX774_g3904 [Zancudomyces culisetae]|eukprot:OMH82611.1 hypothetical protein AX774_g3904 [Zancudomyces culisetae]